MATASVASLPLGKCTPCLRHYLYTSSFNIHSIHASTKYWIQNAEYRIPDPFAFLVRIIGTKSSLLSVVLARILFLSVLDDLFLNYLWIFPYWVDPDPEDPYVFRHLWILLSSSKNSKKNLDSYYLVTSLRLFSFENWRKCNFKK